MLQSLVVRCAGRLSAFGAATEPSLGAAPMMAPTLGFLVLASGFAAKRFELCRWSREEGARRPAAAIPYRRDAPPRPSALSPHDDAQSPLLPPLPTAAARPPHWCPPCCCPSRVAPPRTPSPVRERLSSIIRPRPLTCPAALTKPRWYLTPPQPPSLQPTPNYSSLFFNQQHTYYTTQHIAVHLF